MGSVRPSSQPASAAPQYQGFQEATPQFQSPPSAAWGGQQQQSGFGQSAAGYGQQSGYGQQQQGGFVPGQQMGQQYQQAYPQQMPSQMQAPMSAQQQFQQPQQMA